MNKFLTILLFGFFSYAGEFKFKFSAPEINCGYCEDTIKAYVSKIRTVTQSQFDFKKKTIEFTFKENKPLTKKELKVLFDKKGYTLKEL